MEFVNTTKDFVSDYLFGNKLYGAMKRSNMRLREVFNPRSIFGFGKDTVQLESLITSNDNFANLYLDSQIGLTAAMGGVISLNYFGVEGMGLENYPGVAGISKLLLMYLGNRRIKKIDNAIDEGVGKMEFLSVEDLLVPGITRTYEEGARLKGPLGPVQGSNQSFRYGRNSQKYEKDGTILPDMDIMGNRR